MNYVKYEDFNKMDMRLGLIRFVEPVEGTDKLLRFEIDFGEQTRDCQGECTPQDCDHTGNEECTCEPNCECEMPETTFGKEEYEGRDVRQIVSGIREFFPEYEELVGKYSLYILNLEPREIRGVMSHGMLMAVDDLESKPIFLGPQGEVKPGSRVR
ncbi:MAG: tRNA-binding EMAP/Myf-like protein [Candidatus Paceibacteria bacterium]|jgi:tRNA-binding EMAP/Myf-like protein